MYAQRIEVLHRHYGEAEVRRIADNLEFNLLPAFERFLDQYLARVGKRALAVSEEFLVVVAYSRAETAEGIARTDHHRITDAVCHGKSILKILNSLRHRGLHLYFVQFLNEKIAVLGYHDGFDRCAEHFHTVLVESTVEIELCTAVKCRLAAESKQNTVGTLFLYHFLHKMRSDRQEIYTVGNTFRRLDGGDVRIDEH